MTNRNSLLGRSRPRERLTKEEVAALEKATAPPTPKPRQAKPPENKTSGTQRTVRKNLMKFHWTVECPACGFKVAGTGNPRPGQRLARCGRCKIALFLEGRK